MYTVAIPEANLSQLKSSPSATLTLLLAVFLSSCASTSAPAPDQPLALKADQPFTAGGNIELQLAGGNYEIRPASGDHIRVSFGGNPGTAVAEVTATGTHAHVSVKDTPHNNLKALIEVPQTADLVLHLTGGNLALASITGNKEIDSKAGNVTIAVGDVNDYARVDATVSLGNLDA